MQIKEESLSAGLANLQNLILLGGIVLSMSNVHIHHLRLKLLVSLEDSMLIATRRVPIGEAVGIATTALCCAEGHSELVAITEVVPVTSCLVQESAT